MAEEAHEPGEPTLDPLTEAVIAGLKSLEVKVDQLALDTANLAAKRQPSAKSFADAVLNGPRPDPHQGKLKPGAKSKKPHQAPPPPPQSLKLTLNQLASREEGFVKMTSNASQLTLRAEKALISALREHAEDCNSPPPPLRLRGISRNAFTGDIHLHLTTQESLRAVLSLKSDAWVEGINPGLGLRRKVYPIIVHGIPTTFNPASKRHLKEFIQENHGALDTATKMTWANRYSIEAGKPFSSLIIHLTDPAAANTAIRNRICFKHLLKVTEKSTKRVKQCYKCLDFGHFAKACPEDFRSCSHCAGAHPFDDCPKRAEPLCCVNCAQKYLEVAFPGDSTVSTSKLEPEQRRTCTHSPFLNLCPIRKAQAALTAHVSDFYNTRVNE